MNIQDLNKKSKKQLVDLAKKLNIKNYSKLTKDDLVKAIIEVSNPVAVETVKEEVKVEVVTETLKEELIVPAVKETLTLEVDVEVNTLVDKVEEEISLPMLKEVLENSNFNLDLNKIEVEEMVEKPIAKKMKNDDYIISEGFYQKKSDLNAILFF